MLKDLVHFSSFIEVMIALTIFLIAWDKPKEFIENLLTDKIFPKKVALRESFLKSAQFFCTITNFLFQIGKYFSLISIPYGIVLLLLGSSCLYNSDNNFCQYAIPWFNEAKSLKIHLFVISSTLISYMLTFFVGILYAIYLGIFMQLMQLINLGEPIKKIINKRRKRNQILSKLESIDNNKLDELLKHIK